MLDVLALPNGIAFDETGGLWLAYSGGKFARLAASQLTASGNIAPQIVITSSDIGSAEWFAIYPAPTSRRWRTPCPDHWTGRAGARNMSSPRWRKVTTQQRRQRQDAGTAPIVRR